MLTFLHTILKKVAEETKKTPVWVHFGAGNIFRIFIGGIADELISSGEMKKGITCVETFDFDVVDKIYRPYDNLVLAVTLKADGSTDKKILGSDRSSQSPVRKCRRMGPSERDISDKTYDDLILRSRRRDMR